MTALRQRAPAGARFPIHGDTFLMPGHFGTGGDVPFGDTGVLVQQLRDRRGGLGCLALSCLPQQLAELDPCLLLGTDAAGLEVLLPPGERIDADIHRSKSSTRQLL